MVLNVLTERNKSPDPVWVTGEGIGLGLGFGVGVTVGVFVGVFVGGVVGKGADIAETGKVSVGKNCFVMRFQSTTRIAAFMNYRWGRINLGAVTEYIDGRNPDTVYKKYTQDTH